MTVLSPMQRTLPGRLALRRLVVGAALAGLLGAASPVVAQESIEDLRQEREDNRRSAADVASELDALGAEDRELVDALTALDSYIDLQQAKVDGAEAAIAEAEQAATDARARADSLGGEIDELRARLRDRAVDAFVAPRRDVLDQLDSDDLLESALRQSFLADVVGDEYDLVDQLRTAVADQEAARRTADEAAADAGRRRDDLQVRLDELATSRAEAEQLRAQVQGRIAEWEAVGAEIAAADAAISSEIRRLEEEAARRAAEQEAARRAAEEEAARRAAEEAAAGADGSDTADESVTDESVTEPVASGSFAVTHRPVPGPITSSFGARVHPIFGTVRQHYGADLDGDTGDPIAAAAAGTVLWAGPRNGYGNTVVIGHGAGFTTLYAHMSSIAVVAGATVGGGDVVGAVGSTGWSTGPHLHFEVRVDGVAVDPAPYL